MRKTNSDQLHGTLDMLVLKVLDNGPVHGYGIAVRLQQLSKDVLQVEEGSAAQQAAALLPDSTVIGAFHNVSAVLLDDADVDRVDTDVLVLGEVREATDLVQALAETIPGVRGVYAGRLRNAHQIEALTANLISINRRYKAHSGLRITDV